MVFMHLLEWGAFWVIVFTITVALIAAGVIIGRPSDGGRPHLTRRRTFLRRSV